MFQLDKILDANGLGHRSMFNVCEPQMRREEGLVKTQLNALSRAFEHLERHVWKNDASV